MHSETEASLYEAASALLYSMVQGTIDEENSWVGICSNLSVALGRYPGHRGMVDFLIASMEDWPEYSGNRDYPVMNQEMYNTNNGSMYGDDEYGLARRRLAAYLLKRLEEEYGNAFEIEEARLMELVSKSKSY